MKKYAWLIFATFAGASIAQTVYKYPSNSVAITNVITNASTTLVVATPLPTTAIGRAASIIAGVVPNPPDASIEPVTVSSQSGYNVVVVRNAFPKSHTLRAQPRLQYWVPPTATCTQTNTFTSTPTNTPTNAPTAGISIPMPGTVYLATPGYNASIDLLHAGDINFGSKYVEIPIWVAIGDSITNIMFNGAHTNSFTYNGIPVSVIDCGVFGWQATDGIDNAYTAYSPYLTQYGGLKIASVAFGTNDIVAQCPQVVAQRIRSLCDHLRWMGFNKILVATLLSRNGNSTSTCAGTNDANRVLLNNIIRKDWSDYADGLVDLAGIIHLGGVGDYSNLAYFQDGIHPLYPDSYALMQPVYSAAVSNVINQAMVGNRFYPLNGTTAPTPSPRYIGDTYISTSGPGTIYSGISLTPVTGWLQVKP